MRAVLMSGFDHWYVNILKRELGSYDPEKARIEAEFRHCWSAAQSAPHSRIVVRFGITEEAMEICQGMRERYMPWVEIAKALGVHDSTLRRAWKRSGRTMKYLIMQRTHELYMARTPWKVIAREVDMQIDSLQDRYAHWRAKQKQKA